MSQEPFGTTQQGDEAPLHVEGGVLQIGNRSFRERGRWARWAISGGRAGRLPSVRDAQISGNLWGRLPEFPGEIPDGVVGDLVGGPVLVPGATDLGLVGLSSGRGHKGQHRQSEQCPKSYRSPHGAASWLVTIHIGVPLGDLI